MNHALKKIPNYVIRKLIKNLIKTSGLCNLKYYRGIVLEIKNLWSSEKNI